MSDDVKKANRQVYNNAAPDVYNRNESIFNRHRRLSISAIVSECARQSGNDACLDVGTGTGNLLEFLQEHFTEVCAVDIGERLLAKIAAAYPDCLFAGADAEDLPFKAGSFNCVTCYALLHHLVSHEQIFSEAFRVLKPGGVLYTDHDPNYYFTRFYHILYKILHSNKPGFGTEVEELAEYHNTKSSGIDPEKLKEILLETGFSSVRIQYRITDKSSGNLVLNSVLVSMKTLANIFPCRSLRTHFSILAVK